MDVKGRGHLFQKPLFKTCLIQTIQRERRHKSLQEEITLSVNKQHPPNIADLLLLFIFIP